MLQDQYDILKAFLNVSSQQDPVFYYLKVALLTLIAAIAIRLATRMLRLLLRYTTITAGLQGIIASVAQIALWAVLVIQLLSALHLDNVVTFFSGSALAIGILLAAGGTTLLSDIVAGIFLAQDGDFAVGDEVIAGENSTRGIIESMDARRTRIRTEDGILHVIPNSLVERKEWQLIKRSQSVSPIAQAVRRARSMGTAKKKPAAKRELEPTAPAAAAEIAGATPSKASRKNIQK